MTVKLSDVGIRYIIGDIKNIGLKDYIILKMKGQQQTHEFWAVDGVSFALNKGDFLGIVGNNGAGKSTLLKAIAGIIQPVRGSVVVEGKVAALLELGTGFDGEMTVRENTFLRGALMGYTREFMRDTYPEIITFAELDEFQDRPFRQLSSGMRSRLAFSIACLVKPDILILDEVLSVGDGSFKEKSEARMKSIISGGAITLFVSHSLSQMRQLCNKVLWLDKGKQIAFGDADKVISQYEAFIKKKCVSYICDSHLEASETDLIVENETCFIEITPSADFARFNVFADIPCSSAICMISTASTATPSANADLISRRAFSN